MGCCHCCNRLRKAVHDVCSRCLRTRAPRTQEMEGVNAAGSGGLTLAMEIITSVYDIEMVQEDASHSDNPLSVSSRIAELSEVDKGRRGESTTSPLSNLGSCGEEPSVLASNKEHISTLLEDIPMLTDIKVSTPALPSVTGGRAVSGSESEQQSVIPATPELDGSDVARLREQTDERLPLSSTGGDGGHTTLIPDVSSVATYQKEEEEERGSSPLTDKTGESTGAAQHDMEYEGPQSAPGEAVDMEVQTGAVQDMECQEEGQGVEQDSGKQQQQQQDKTSSQEKWPDTAHDQRVTTPQSPSTEDSLSPVKCVDCGIPLSAEVTRQREDGREALVCDVCRTAHLRCLQYDSDGKVVLGETTANTQLSPEVVCEGPQCKLPGCNEQAQAESGEYKEFCSKRHYQMFSMLTQIPVSPMLPMSQSSRMSPTSPTVPLQNGSQEGNCGGQNSGDSGAQGGDSGALGGDSGALGGDSGAQGGDSGAQGGDSGALGGDSGAQGGDSGAQGGDSGALGGDSGALGGDSGALGGDSGALGGDSVAQEGDSGAQGGDSGAQEGDSGAQGGDSGAQGGDSGAQEGDSGAQGGDSVAQGGDGGALGGDSGALGVDGGALGGDSVAQRGDSGALGVDGGALGVDSGALGGDGGALGGDSGALGGDGGALGGDSLGAQGGDGGALGGDSVAQGGDSGAQGGDGSALGGDNVAQGGDSVAQGGDSGALGGDGGAQGGDSGTQEGDSGAHEGDGGTQVGDVGAQDSDGGGQGGDSGAQDSDSSAQENDSSIQAVEASIQGGDRISRGTDRGHTPWYLPSAPTPRRKICKFPGCQRPCYEERDGRVHDFCGWTHAQQYLTQQTRSSREVQNQHKENKQQGTGWWLLDKIGIHLSSGSTQQRGPQPIKFYHKHDPYYEFTNFYQAPLQIDGRVWATSENYFQAQKYIGTPLFGAIQQSQTAREAFDISRTPVLGLQWRRSDWEEVKDDVMYVALYAKFTQHERLRRLLLDTDDRRLVEHTSRDSYWGDGGDGSGQNKLGQLLMKLRKELREELKKAKGDRKRKPEDGAEPHSMAKVSCPETSHDGTCVD